jgi:hypothetical protein
MNIFHFKDYLRFREAVKMADEAYSKTGQRHYVMYNSNGGLIVLDRKNFRIMKQKHYIGKDVTIDQLARECFYYTPYGNGTAALDPQVADTKRKNYYAYCDAVHAYKRKKRFQAFKARVKKLLHIK